MDVADMVVEVTAEAVIENAIGKAELPNMDGGGDVLRLNVEGTGYRDVAYLRYEAGDRSELKRGE